MFADDGAGAWEAVVFVEGVLEAHQLLVFVVGVDGDLIDQTVEVGIGWAGWRSRGLLGFSGGGLKAVQHEWRAADLAALEAPDRAVHTDDGGVLVEFDDDALGAMQVAWARLMVDLHAVPDA